MEKILGNFLAQQNNDFPLDCETLNYLQTNQHMAEMIGAIAGDKIILSGCDIAGSVRREGYVFLKTHDFPQGEVLYFEGGDKTHTTLFLEKSAIAVTANAEPYPNAYTKRMLRAGLGSEQYNWSDFVTLTNKTNRQLRTEIESLQAQIATLQPAPAGSIMMWPANTIPSGWALCNGSSYSRSEYSALFSVLGTTYGADDNSTFKLPDMRGLFVAGRGANGYNSINQKGGANTVILTTDQMPSHKHNLISYNDDYNSGGGGGSNDNGNNSPWLYGLAHDSCSSSNYTTFKKVHENLIENAGGGAAHENRPPYIVLNYIIKLK